MCLNYIYSYIAAIIICYAYVAVAYMAGLFLNPAFFEEKKMVTHSNTAVVPTVLHNAHVVDAAMHTEMFLYNKESPRDIGIPCGVVF